MRGQGVTVDALWTIRRAKDFRTGRSSVTESAPGKDHAAIAAAYSRALDKVSRMLGRTVNPTVYSNAEFSKRTKTDNAFVNRVLEGPKVWVIGVGDSVLVNA